MWTSRKLSIAYGGKDYDRLCVIWDIKKCQTVNDFFNATTLSVVHVDEEVT